MVESNENVPREFELARYMGKNMFMVDHVISSSDTEAFTQKELLAMADDECLSLWDNLKLDYTEFAGHPLLLKEIAKLRGVQQVDNVLTLSPSEGIYIGIKCMIAYVESLNPGKPIHAICTFPGYKALFELPRYFGCSVDYWTGKMTSSGWKFDLEELKQLVTQDTKILVVNFPHNPTGFVPSAKEWLQLVEFCKERDLFLFSDEIYAYSSNDGSDALPCAAKLYDKAVSMGGLSKVFGLPGLRSGWACSQNTSILERMTKYKDYTSLCACAPGEILSIIALRNAKHILESHTLPIIRKILEILDTFFAKHSDVFEWHRPLACTVGFVKIKGWLLELGGGTATGVCAKLLDEKRVCMVPGTKFGCDDQYARISFCRKNISEGFALLEEFLEKHKRE